LDFLYEAAPAGGITAAVDPQSWDGDVFALAIREGHLVPEPRCSLGFPWNAYSFSIANPVVIAELWPAAASRPTPAPSVAERPPAEANKIVHLAWAYGELLKKDQIAGLRGKALLNKVCCEVGPSFTASQRTLVKAIQQFKRRAI
jgi:hypothetical protein